MPSMSTPHAAEPTAPVASSVARNAASHSVAATAMMRPVWGFLPFVVVSAVHLVCQLAHLDAAGAVTKWLLMPALIAAVVLSSPARRSTATALLLLAITFSWLGDISLLTPGSLFFMLGLSFFLLAHLGYLAVFVKGLGLARPRLWAVVYLVWWLVFVLILGPNAGNLVLPIAIYGLVLGAMAAWASRGTVLLAVGGALFLISDTLLGSNRFLSDLNIWQDDFLVMLSYLGGQGLIAWAVISVQRRAIAADVAAAATGATVPTEHLEQRG